MSRLSQFLGKDEATPKERFLLEASAVWAAPVSGLYKITAIGGGGDRGSSTSADNGRGENGGATIVQMPGITATLNGGEGGADNGNPSKTAAKGGVPIFAEEMYVRKGGDGGIAGGEEGVGGGLGLHTSMGLNGNLLLRGSGRSAVTNTTSRQLGGGGYGNQYGGGAGGAILYRYPVHLSVGQQITVTIGSGFYSGISIIERF